MNTRWIDRIIYGGAARQIFVLIVTVVSSIFLLSLLVCMCSDNRMMTQEAVKAGESQKNEEHPFAIAMWDVYNHFADPGNQANVNHADRPWAIFISLLGSIVLSGLLISTLSNIMERRVEECRNGLIHYRLSGHIIIIGADAMLASLVKQLCRADKKATLLIQTSRDVNETRMALFSRLSRKDEKRIVLVHAARDSREELKRIYVADAKQVYILGDNGETDEVEYYHDSMNVDCLNLIRDICREKKRSRPLRCNVLFEYQSTFSVFQFADMDKGMKEHVDFCPFNLYEIWAQKVFVSNKCSERDVTYLPLDYEPIAYESEKFVHLVIVGMSRMGIALAIEAAHIAHYPNFVRDPRKRTRITFIDSRARIEMEHFKQAYANLFSLSHATYLEPATGTVEHESPRTEYAHLGTDFIDIEWQFVQGDIESPGVRKLLTDWCLEPGALPTIAICLNLTHHSISSAIYLPAAVYERNIPVLVQQRFTSAIVEKLCGHTLGEAERRYMRFRNLRPFGMIDEGLDLGMADDGLAKRINAVYSRSNAERPLTCLLSRPRMEKLWQNLKTVKRWSNIYHANSIPTKLRSIGYPNQHAWEQLPPLTDREVQLLAQVEHNRWNVEELLLGYRPVYRAEQEAIDREEEKGNNSLRKQKRDREYAHYDIRPYEGLKKASKETDLFLIRHLPLIMRS